MEDGERAEQRRSRHEALACLCLELEVQQRLGDGAQQDDERDVAQVRVPPQHGGAQRGGRSRSAGFALARNGAREHAGAEQAEHREHQQRAGERHELRADPRERSTRHAARRRARADAADDPAGRVGIEALVDERPEARHQRAAKGRDVQVDADRGGGGEGQSQDPPRREQDCGESGGGGHHPRRSTAREHARQQLGPAQRGDRRGGHHQRQRADLEGGKEERVAHGARGDLVRDQQEGRDRRGLGRLVVECVRSGFGHAPGIRGELGSTTILDPGVGRFPHGATRP